MPEPMNQWGPTSKIDDILSLHPGPETVRVCVVTLDLQLMATLHFIQNLSN